MAAAVTVTPNPVNAGQQLTIDGTGFTPGDTVIVQVPERGLTTDLVADVSGEFNSSDLPDHAVATLTLSDVAIADETVTIGSVTYTWKASVSSTANQVKVGADVASCIAALKAAVNNDTTQSTLYGTATVANPDAVAGATTGTTLKFYAKTGGTGGNSKTSTETMTNASFGGTTFAGGAAATGINPFVWAPQTDVPFTVTAKDAHSLTASTTVQVYQTA